MKMAITPLAIVASMAMGSAEDLGVALQFTNYRST